MFSCCALFATEDTGVDMEHLKGLQEVDLSCEASPSIESEVDDAISDADGKAGLTVTIGKSVEETPMVPLSPRAQNAQQRAEEAVVLAKTAENIALEASKGESMLRTQEQVAAEAEVLAQQATRVAEASVVAAEEARVVAQAEAEAASVESVDQTLRALREAEDAAHAAAAEAEKRRFEEEASARAARQAESEARKAIWLAEEAQKAKQVAGSKAAEERAEAQRIVREEAELARRSVAAARSDEAKRHVIATLSSDQGLKLLKHGRNGKTTTKMLYSTEDSFQTLTWGKTVYDLRNMQEVRKGTEADPAHPGRTGTSDLRRAKKATGALDRSFSLLFPERSLDFTAGTKEESEQLVMGFRSLASAHRTYGK